MKLNKELLGESLHTALRKACDSHPTSAAWNCINGMKQQTWGKFLKHVIAEFEKFERPDPTQDSKKTRKAWMSKLREVSLGWEPYREGSEAMTLFCIFECFSDSDWYGFASWLPDCEEKSEEAA